MVCVLTLRMDDVAHSATPGCVRLWQPHWAPRITEQGRIIAQVNADVGYFAIGDRFQSEHELVVWVLFIFLQPVLSC